MMPRHDGNPADFGQKGVSRPLLLRSLYPRSTENSPYKDPFSGKTYPSHMNFGQQMELWAWIHLPWMVDDRPERRKLA